MSLANEDLVILEYVHDRADRDLDRAVDVWSDFERSQWGAAARRLQQAGLIELASVADDYKITAHGLSFVSELRAKRSNGPARMASLRLELIRWLYDYYLEDDGPESTEDFASSGRALYMGRSFGGQEILRAVSYLTTAGLIQGGQVDQSDHIFRPSLTPKGVDCAESGKPVSEFLNPAPGGGPTFNVRIDGSQNVVVGTQSDFTQNNTSGIDPEVLARVAHFAAVARQGISSYGLEEDQQIEVEQIAQELEAEAGGEAPDRGRLRRLTDRLMEAIAPAAGSALGGMVLALGEQAASAIGG
ncbi:hypothetical protein [Streptomyces sp. SID5643]|uniref:hypothetical protein n=1 Tax=Streptomyces sp. SID5643 TaxID=2690307 RepID=UPI0013718C17|nr:hypothetical protein [Streptomyces sp. SID5643]MZF88945.1 hypothetical protein [Streptomyces sp. SID5643]